MSIRSIDLVAAFVLCLATAQARAQEGQPGARPPAAPGSTMATANGPDKKYVDLSHSKDPKIKGLATAYLELMRFQEWGNQAGKSIMGKYVSHDAGLSHVKLAVPKGVGKDRV